jgi:hypothetical protein
MKMRPLNSEMLPIGIRPNENLARHMACFPCEDRDRHAIIASPRIFNQNFSERYTHDGMLEVLIKKGVILDIYSIKDSPQPDNISADAVGLIITMHDNNGGSHKPAQIRRDRESLKTTSYLSSFQTEETNNNNWIKKGLVITSIAVTLITLLASLSIIYLVGLGTLSCLPDGFLTWFVPATLGVVVSNSAFVYKSYFSKQPKS